jgi:hypothetical protein
VADHAPVAAAHPAEKHERLAWRHWVPWVLVVLATVIALVAALNVWVKRQALSTDNWTNASTQLLQNDQIRSALSVYLVDQLYQNVNVTQKLQQRLPPALDPLAPQISLGLEQVAIRATNELLSRPRVQQLWKEANRRAHKLFIAVLDGNNQTLLSSGGNVVLNLQPILKQLADQTGLGSRVAGSLPADAGKITIMKGNQLDTARKTVKVVRVMSYFLLFLVIALYAAAIWIARGRRRTFLLAAGIGILIVGLLLLVIRRYAGDYLVSALTSNDSDKHAVTAAWAIGTQLLRNVGINAVIYGLGIVFAAWIAGPSRAATWCRRQLAPTMREHPLVIYGAVAVALFLVLIAGPTDAQRIFPLLVLFAFAFLGTEYLRRQTAREFPAKIPPEGSARLPAG